MDVIPRPWPEVQAILPPLSRDERESLLASIQQSGVQVQILVLPDGRIIDGHHRWELSDGNAPVEVRDLSEDEAFALALALNLARRQMSPEQLRGAHEQLRRNAELRRKTAEQLRQQGLTQEQAAAVVGVDQRTIGRWEQAAQNQSNRHLPIALVPAAPVGPAGAAVRAKPPDLRTSIPKSQRVVIAERRAGGETLSQIAADYKTTPERIGQIARLVKAGTKPAAEVAAIVPLPDLRARCLVIDPPWPVAKIEREERPDQGVMLDYPTMSEDAILALGDDIEKAVDPTGCHVYLWVTHKHLPLGLRCFDAWGVRYQCLMTWIKNVGFTPFSWMYSTEHIVFGRIGSLDLLKQGIRLDFTGKVREHSRKPDEFYDIVRRASPEPRLEMFAREQHDGFYGWGNEPNHFAVGAGQGSGG